MSVISMKFNFCFSFPESDNEPHCEGSRVAESSWNVMAHGDARERKWRGNWRMEWVASTLHTTTEHGVSSITTADAHNSAAISRLNWRPRRFKWTRPFRRKTKSGFLRVCHHISTGLCFAHRSSQSKLPPVFNSPQYHYYVDRAGAVARIIKNWVFLCVFSSPMFQQPLISQVLLIFQAPQSHSDTPNSVCLLWTSDQPDSETSTWHTQHSQRQISMLPAGFEPAIPASEQSDSLRNARMIFVLSKFIHWLRRLSLSLPLTVIWEDCCSPLSTSCH